MSFGRHTQDNFANACDYLLELLFAFRKTAIFGLCLGIICHANRHFATGKCILPHLYTNGVLHRSKITFLAFLNYKPFLVSFLIRWLPWTVVKSNVIRSELNEEDRNKAQQKAAPLDWNVQYRSSCKHVNCDWISFWMRWCLTGSWCYAENWTLRVSLFVLSNSHLSCFLAYCCLYFVKSQLQYLKMIVGQIIGIQELVLQNYILVGVKTKVTTQCGFLYGP